MLASENDTCSKIYLIFCAVYFKCGVVLSAAVCDTVNVMFFIFSGILEEQVDGPE